MIIKDEHLWLHERSGRLLLKSKRSSNRLYKVELCTGKPMCFQAKLDMESLPWLWHGRLGHANFDSIKIMVSKHMVKGVPTIKNPSKLCEACLAGKHTRTPFPCYVNIHIRISSTTSINGFVWAYFSKYSGR